MKLILSLSVLAVALLMVLEGPAPAQADSGINEDLKALVAKVQEAVDTVKNSNIWLGPFPGRGRTEGGRMGDMD
ncbi:hypothetical protein D623_10006036 [Myotis brandtii]|uniref:Apolipoprotein C-I n=1 Tax=Myotis brandtii TaxID=109478 RepID=S7MP42_MYOBR|nr:hypothetical protein D623_10006036 [Myotis brandtii]